MEIKSLGWQSFRIQEGGLVVLTQPFSQKKTKLSFPKVKADLVLQSRNTESALKSRVSGANQDKVFWAPGPGEYEVAGVEARGFPSGYWFKMRNFQLAFWWDLDLEGIKKLSKDFPNIDILLLKGSQNGKGMGKKLKEAARKVSPSILIPFCSETIAKTEMATGKWAKGFLDALDQENIKPQEKLSINKEAVSSEELKVVLLESKL